MDSLGGKVVIMINPDETYWSSDGSLPLEEPNTMHYLLVNQEL